MAPSFQVCTAYRFPQAGTDVREDGCVRPVSAKLGVMCLPYFNVASRNDFTPYDGW